MFEITHASGVPCPESPTNKFVGVVSLMGHRTFERSSNWVGDAGFSPRTIGSI